MRVEDENDIWNSWLKDSFFLMVPKKKSSVSNPSMFKGVFYTELGDEQALLFVKHPIDEWLIFIRFSCYGKYVPHMELILGIADVLVFFFREKQSHV